MENKPPNSVDAADTKTIATLERLRKEALAGGGERRVTVRHDRGKLTARERIDLLLDEGSFEEVGMLKIGRAGGGEPEYPGDGVITGHGTIDGREVFVSGCLKSLIEAGRQAMEPRQTVATGSVRSSQPSPTRDETRGLLPSRGIREM